VLIFMNIKMFVIALLASALSLAHGSSRLIESVAKSQCVIYPKDAICTRLAGNRVLLLGDESLSQAEARVGEKLRLLESLRDESNGDCVDKSKRMFCWLIYLPCLEKKVHKNVKALPWLPCQHHCKKVWQGCASFWFTALRAHPDLVIPSCGGQGFGLSANSQRFGEHPIVDKYLAGLDSQDVFPKKEYTWYSLEGTSVRMSCMDDQVRL